jgi:hypothetical protein
MCLHIVRDNLKLEDFSDYHGQCVDTGLLPLEDASYYHGQCLDT